MIALGIIGFGRIGALHAEWLEEAQGIRVVAVADATEARRKLAGERGLRAVENVDALIRDASIDALLVSSPTAMHFEHASATLAARKHVMVEKPMALDLKQARELNVIAQQNGRVLSVFHNRRWDLDYLTVKRAIDEGRFGKLINIESRIGQWESCVGPAAKEWRPNWRNEAQFGGGGLYDWGSHFLDQMWRLMFPAKPQAVFAQLRGNVWSKDCDDFARVCIDFDNDAVAMVEINTTTTRPLPRWHIDGVSGSADSPHSLNYDQQTWATLHFTAPGDPPRTAPLPLATRGLTEADIWEQFASACEGKGSPAVRAESVLPTMALLDAARESSRTERSVAITDAVEWVLA